MKTRLLFLSLLGCDRARMATGWVRRQPAAAGVEVAVACIHSAPDDPLLAGVLADAGLDPEAGTMPGVSLDELAAHEFDVVVVLCREASRDLPALPGQPAIVQWRLPPPHLGGGDAARRRELVVTCEAIRGRVEALFQDGYWDAFLGLRGVERMILDCVNDGIFVHDFRRRILFFNRAAEELTGIRREEALGRDCHSVFTGQFCSRGCLLHDPEGVSFDERRQRCVYSLPDGTVKVLDTRVVPLRDRRGGKPVGVVVTFRDQTRVEQLERRMEAVQSFSGIVGQDAKMQAVYALIRDVADSNVPVLIHGESGTGKELVAAAIHNEGPRAAGPFVAVNCGALSESLLESELFGHVRGAFTGAVRDKKGRFELASGGTLFLDEVGDISPAMQVRLLRVLQDGCIQRVGGETTVQVDVRIISATHRDLRREVAAGHFREDLYYRLNVVPIELPPLRQRRADIPLLADHLLKRFLAELGRSEPVRVGLAALDVLLAYDWPGNVRELQNWLQFALVKCRHGEIQPEHLPSGMPAPAPPERAAGGRGRAVRDRLTVARVCEVLAEQGGERRAAARALGISRATLYRFFAAHPNPAWQDVAANDG